MMFPVLAPTIPTPTLCTTDLQLLSKLHTNLESEEEKEPVSLLMKLPDLAITPILTVSTAQSSLSLANCVVSETETEILAQQVSLHQYSDYEIPASIPNVPNYIMSSVHSASGVHH